MSHYLKMAEALEQIGRRFNLAPFAEILQPLIEEVLKDQNLSKCRKGTLLVPKVLIWLVLVLTLRRDLNYHQALNWMMSGYRWLEGLIPPQAKMVADGTISHARVKLGVRVFSRLFTKLTGTFKEIEADFHDWMTVVFDGTTGTMPDSKANKKIWSTEFRSKSRSFPSSTSSVLVGRVSAADLGCGLRQLCG